MATNLTNFYERGTDVADIYIGKDEVEKGILNRSINTDVLSDIGLNELTQYTLWGWGKDNNKNLGINYNNTSIPAIVTTENCVWRTVSISSVPTAAIAHIVSLKCDGTLWSWGNNQCGQIGDNSITQRFTPTQEISQNTTWACAIAGGFHTTAMKLDGSIWSWGSGKYGLIANNCTNNYCSPIQEITQSLWQSFSTSNGHALAVKTNGTFWSWGSNSFGQLANGAGPSVSASSPVQELCNDTSWCSVSAGATHSIMLKTNGSLWGSGHNSTGQLGDGTTVSSNSPVRETTNSTDWRKITAGAFISGGIKSNSTLYMWGSNGCGQLGDSTIISKCVPIQEITQSQNWNCIVSAKESGHTAAIKTDGTLWSWGRNASGELGNGSTTSTSSPVQESKGIDTWINVAAGSCSTIGLKR
jgi:alpha-tubulin suppressor-like RCC1 family protein